MEQQSNTITLAVAWINAIIGTLLTSELLAGLAYIGSIAGSAVYIYTTIKKHKEHEKDIEKRN